MSGFFFTVNALRRARLRRTVGGTVISRTRALMEQSGGSLYGARRSSPHLFPSPASQVMGRGPSSFGPASIGSWSSIYMQPNLSKVRFKKEKKGRLRSLETRKNTIRFGDYGLKALVPARITNRQIEAARKVMRRLLAKQGQLIIRIFPHTPVTRKPNEVRMGKGKGNVATYVAKVSAGTMMFELRSVDVSLAKAALEAAGEKLPLPCKFVQRRSLDMFD